MVNLYDNSNEQSQVKTPIVHFLREAKNIKIATGYFYLGGYDEIKKFLPNNLTESSFKILMGDETDIFTARELTKGYEIKGESLKQNVMKRTIEELADIANHEKREAINEIKNIQDLYEQISRGIIDVKVFTKGKFHVKLFLFIEKPAELIKERENIHRSPGNALLGSSNFSRPGLTKAGNIELNVALNDKNTILDLNEWFDQKWEVSEPFKDDLLKIITSQGFIGDSPERIFDQIKDVSLGTYITPMEMFTLLAWHFLDGRIDLREERNILTLFQEIGVINAEIKLKKLYGAIIADSVGLGKSFIAGKIIRNYLLGNPYGSGDYWGGHLATKWREVNKGILLIVPAHLQNQWRDNVLFEFFLRDCLARQIDDNPLHFYVLHKEGRNLGQIKIISYAKFSRINEKPILHQLSDMFDLIVLDEAHRIRNGSLNKSWINLQEIKKKQSYLLEPEDDKALTQHIRNRFLLLSATPLNNRIEDLINMFLVFIDRDFRDLINLGKNILLFDEYKEIKDRLKKQPRNADLLRKQKENVQEIKTEILDDLILLRTRHYIKSNDKYRDIVIDGRSIEFKDPIIRKIRYDEKLIEGEYYEEFLDIYNTLDTFLAELNFPYVDIFSKSEDVKGTIRILMRVLLLKRMESSIFSFERSIKSIREKEEYLLQLIANIEDINIIREEWRRKYKTKLGLEEEREDEELSNEIVESFSQIEDETEDFDFNQLKKSILEDLKILDSFEREIEDLKEENNSEYPTYKDPKYLEFNSLIQRLFDDFPNTKILAFTQFKDTADYLKNKISEWITKNPDYDRIIKLGQITGTTKREFKEKLVGRFAPLANNYRLDSDTELNLLISTDALSEGVNLQDASIVVNYDLPWNPMRIVQRVGRVNRIGSINQVYVYNFFPDQDLDSLLRLLSKLKDKIKDVQNLLAKEMQILSEEEEITVETFGEKIKETREQTDINALESSSKSSDFADFEAYGEDQETLEKLKIINILEQMEVDEDYFNQVIKNYQNKKVFTILDKGKVLQYYQIWDKIRKEKMADFLIQNEAGHIEEVPKTDIKSLLEPGYRELVEPFFQKSSDEVKERLNQIHHYFKKYIYKKFLDIFTFQKQARKVELKGMQKKFVSYLRRYKKQNRLFLDENSEKEDEFIKQKINTILEIYQSITLRNIETKELKGLFLDKGFNLDTAKVSEIPIKDFLDLLFDFYELKLAPKGSTVFSGIRTKKDLFYKTICWYS